MGLQSEAASVRGTPRGGHWDNGAYRLPNSEESALLTRDTAILMVLALRPIASRDHNLYVQRIRVLDAPVESATGSILEFRDEFSQPNPPCALQVAAGASNCGDIPSAVGSLEGIIEPLRNLLVLKNAAGDIVRLNNRF